MLELINKHFNSHGDLVIKIKSPNTSSSCRHFSMPTYAFHCLIVFMGPRILQTGLYKTGFNLSQLLQYPVCHFSCSGTQGYTQSSTSESSWVLYINKEGCPFRNQHRSQFRKKKVKSRHCMLQTVKISCEQLYFNDTFTLFIPSTICRE